MDLPRAEGLSAQDLVAWAVDSFGDGFAIAISFQKEAMALVDMACRLQAKVRAFTLDTGRLPKETFHMIETVRQRYGVEVELLRPDPAEVDEMVGRYGADLFRDSVELRQLCCDVRKVRPLERKLAELKAWATGMRREQAENRAKISVVEHEHGLVKLNPLADWTQAQVEEYTEKHRVPVHPLYSQGYTSIGCEPCTRALQRGENGRAGRWWWEQTEHKECGIHFLPTGEVRRAFTRYKVS